MNRVRAAVRATAVAIALLPLLAAMPAAAKTPFWGATASSPVDTPPAGLEPGEWVWNPAPAPQGPITVLVSLDDQLAYVYRNGIEIGYTTVSSGKAGHETPTGVFTILQKDKDHHSSIYNNAAMPDTMRLTWGGVALHAGGLPGYPSSHGCVHLPSKFADELYAVSPMGMTVVVVADATAPAAVARPTALAPIDAATGAESVEPRLAAGEAFRWQPEKSPEGPVSVVISGADRRLIVLRNGVEIGRTRIEIRDPLRPLGSHVYVVREDAQPAAPGQPRQPAPHWVGVGMPGHFDEEGRDLTTEAMARVRIPRDFTRLAEPLLVPGTTLLVVDAPILPTTSGPSLTVLSNGPAP